MFKELNDMENTGNLDSQNYKAYDDENYGGGTGREDEKQRLVTFGGNARKFKL